MAVKALEIDALAVSIAGSQVLRGINFTVYESELVGIIGPNGSGKTTLFNCISGFHRGISGKIIYRTQAIQDLHPHQRASLGIARIFQNFGIFREMTVLDNMLIALERKLTGIELLLPSSKHARKLKEQALTFLEKVGLHEKSNLRASALSGGQMRLLEISRALAFGADLFLLDEPTAGVSPKLKENVANLIIELHKLGKTVMVIEHDINFIEAFCNRILVLNEGQIVIDDKPEAIHANPLLQEIYFGKGQKKVAANGLHVDS